MNTVTIPERYQNLFFNYIKSLDINCKNYTIHRHEDTEYIVPSDSSFTIDYQGNIVLVNISRENDKPLFNGEKLSYLLLITIRHDDLSILKSLVKTIVDKNNGNGGTVQVFHSRHCGYWDRASRVFGQTLDNIFLPGNIKTDIVNHIDSFLSNRERYLKFGRTYKLCFLFTGVPGSGKSSLIKSIAVKYNRPIYVLSLSKKLEDESLNILMGEVPQDSIIVLEDIDSFFIDREAKSVNVSFSAILNLFDGLFTPGNGTILFMTANNPEQIDNALIRPGRVDKIVKFDYPRKKEINDAFDKIVGGDNFGEFYKQIDGNNISMAAIVDYLFRHTTDYLECIEELNIHTKLLDEINNGNQHFYK